VYLTYTNKSVIFFSLTKLEDKRVEHILPKEIGTGGRGEEVGKKVWEGEYSANTVYTCI
jgi:hypothetical protein